jgi:hypothetical protein
MPFFIAQPSAVQFCTSEAVKSQIGGPDLYDLLTFLDTVYDSWTLGRWESDIVREGGAVPPGVSDNLYKSPTWTQDNLDLIQFGRILLFLQEQNLYMDVTQYPTFVTVAAADYTTQDVADYILNAYVLDPDTGEPTATLKKWNAWTDSLHPHQISEDRTEIYIAMNSDTGNNDTIGSVIVQMMSDGYFMRRMEDWPEAPPETRQTKSPN